MQTRFLGYRTHCARRPNWDYTRGIFFITLVTGGRARVLSKIVHGRVVLTDAGAIVHQEWYRTVERRSHVSLDRFVVMPDHFQALIELKQDGATAGADQASPGLQPESLAAIVGQFKAQCASRIKEEALPDFAWAPGFHDVIVRNRRQLENKRTYIQANPKEWARKTHEPTAHP
jgi:putative transposase